MSRKAVKIHASSNTSDENKKMKEELSLASNISLETLLEQVATELKSGSDAALYTVGTIGICLLVSLVSYSTALCPLVYLGFTFIVLPYRVVSFWRRRWTFFLVDFCYFANLACCGFMLLAPEDRRLEATVYTLCEGPLAAALLAWQCAWLFSSPDHVISVLIHLLPGLAMYCHRFLASSRHPSMLFRGILLALVGKAGPWMAAPIDDTTAATVSSVGSIEGWGRLITICVQRLAAAAAVARGAMPCPTFAAPAATAATATLAHGMPVRVCGMPYTGSTDDQAFPNGGCCANCVNGTTSFLADGIVSCSASAGPPLHCPEPAWLWLGVAPLIFYLAWQQVYFLVVQVVFRQVILAGGYDTSYSCLARRAQRANSPLNRFVRRGSIARRVFMYGFLQLLFTIVSQMLAIVTYHSFVAATVWQVVKFVVPLYLGACQQCYRLPAQQLRAAATRLAAKGLQATETVKPPRIAEAAGDVLKTQ